MPNPTKFRILNYPLIWNENKFQPNADIKTEVSKIFSTYLVKEKLNL